jgi:hypothetical protein
MLGAEDVASTEKGGVYNRGSVQTDAEKNDSEYFNWLYCRDFKVRW